MAPALGLNRSIPAIETAHAQTAPDGLAWRHAVSTYGDIKYPADFKRFDYVNPDAPKGGVVRLFELGTFDNFNIVIQGLKGSIANGATMINQTLTTRSQDEPSTAYGLLAEAAAYPDDFSYVVYRLNAAARWHDGKPVTPDDVVFSFDAFKKNSPMYSAYYRHIVKCEKAGERDVRFTFDGPGNRELPRSPAKFRYCRSTGGKAPTPRAQTRCHGDNAGNSAGLRAYRIREFVAGRALVLERVKDYWGKDLPRQHRSG